MAGRDRPDRDEDRVGRLLDQSGPDQTDGGDGPGWVDEEKDAVADLAEPDRDDELSAEEAAVHLTSDPPMHDLGDGYVEPGGTST